ncbi:MAG: hypothetical protein U9P14_10010, partial [Gemmatimonadota bacterium]|nr:hypothetical protein [Gemmatimonadota bacterium]
MAKKSGKKKKSRRRGKPVNTAPGQGRAPAADSVAQDAAREESHGVIIPGWSDPDETIAFWTGNLNSGFEPEQLRVELEKAPRAALNTEQSAKLEALALFAAAPLGRVRTLEDGP